MSSKMKYFCFAAVFAVAFVGWRIASSSGYESAAYEVVEADSPFEIRDYPELKTAATSMKDGQQGEDGSFMRLFGYISGANSREQKIAMTTPVFMQAGGEESKGQMLFVLPEEVAAKEIPEPTGQQVTISRRPAGRYAVIRFNGRMNSKSVAEAETTLRQWIKSKELKGEQGYETAGYDPPWTPGRFRRNEVLIRLTGKESKQAIEAAAPTPDDTTQQSENGGN